MPTFFGFHMPNFSFPGVPVDGLFDRIVADAQAAEAAGFDLVTVMDHFYQIGPIGPESEPMLEAYTTLAALAGRTSRVKLGTLVTGVTYRNPALLAKMVSTLDVISKGRALMGIGAAWNASEHAGYGFDFPPVPERMNRLDEALTILRAMFREERPSFQGRYYRIERALNVPRPIQPGGPKILIGGGGEQRTLRILARHGDIGHWFGGNLDDLRRKKAVFERHCEAVGRDPASVLLTVGLSLVLVERAADAAPVLAAMPGGAPRARPGPHDPAGRGPARRVPRRGLRRLHVQQPNPADRRFHAACGRADQSRRAPVLSGHVRSPSVPITRTGAPAQTQHGVSDDTPAEERRERANGRRAGGSARSRSVSNRICVSPEENTAVLDFSSRFAGLRPMRQPRGVS